jgi:hypothetical protein
VSNVTIDLNGYYLVNSPFSGPSFANGIWSENKANIRVKNGEIVDFSNGITAQDGSPNRNFGHLVEDVRFYNNDSGVSYWGSTGCVVRNCQFCQFIGLGGRHGYAVFFFEGTGNRAVGNVATGMDIAFYSAGSNYLDSNYADDCNYGIYAFSPTTKLRFNTTTNCNTGVQGGTSELANDQ